MDSVLRCGQCNKPFDKESTLKRHRYYCRQKKGGNNTRTRSCIACAKRKARCDNGKPGCLSCRNKAIECHYPTTTTVTKSTAPRTQQSRDDPIEKPEALDSLNEVSPTIGNYDAEGNTFQGRLGDMLATSTTNFLLGGDDFPDWNDPDIDFSSMWNLQTVNEKVQYLPTTPLTLSPDRPLVNLPDLQAQQMMYSSNTSIPPVPSANTRSLIWRPKVNTGTQRIGNLIFHTLKSYPVMMQRYDTLPPFIHPSSVSSDREDTCMEPLVNCISLMRMTSSEGQGSRKLFWKNVKMECEQICDKHLDLDGWGLLAAMQALSIYILTRLEESETDYNDCDFLLVATVAAISRALTRNDMICYTEPTLYRRDWNTWIFEESRRRLAVVYRVMNMLVYFDPAAICTLQTDLILAPLPARKQLWETSNESIWKAEYDRRDGPVVDFGLAANGDLVRLDEAQTYCGDKVLQYKALDAMVTSRGSSAWEEWCAGMDSFGGLIMLAASLVE